MSDLISRQAAKDALAKLVPYAICDTSTESYTNGLTDAYNLICQLPSAQTERKKGKWIPQFDKWGDYVTTTEGYKCSECGEFDSMKDNFCPNCGADMRGEANDRVFGCASTE